MLPQGRVENCSNLKTTHALDSTKFKQPYVLVFVFFIYFSCVFGLCVLKYTAAK